MKRFTLIICAIVALAATSASSWAQMVTFDFNSLENRDRDNPISEYMTSVYGSSVETDGSRVSDETSIPGGVTDLFIATSLQLLNRGDFEIVFGDVPIIGAQFEGHVLDPTHGEDFHFRAFNGDTEVFMFMRDEGEEMFDSGWMSFPSPVDRIVISDSGRIDVGIDDLTVQVVPEPVTATLMLAGLAGAMIRRKRS